MSRQASLLSIAGILLGGFGLWYLWGLFSAPAKMTAERAADVALHAPTPRERERAASVLAPMGNEAVPAMRQVLQVSDTPEVKAAMIQGLGMERDFDSMDFFLSALDDESLLVRSRAGCAVQRLLQIEGPYRADAPLAERRKAAQGLREEWEKMRRTPGLKKFREKLRQEAQSLK